MKNKSTKKNSKGRVSEMMAKTKNFAVKTNDKALERTEAAVTTSLEVTAQWQKVADKALKGGLKLAANQQDLVFDILNEIKDHALAGKEKFRKLVA
ncbi:hypothetical protein ABV409_02320 [Flagellimonas sp. DF-77]|uniref:hypothetical protein n=1 Tax=Flagellimonas algarum TaxID=3230298 RepID=UPI0033943A2A